MTTVDTRAQTITDLRAAATVQRRRGWTRRRFVEPSTGRVCAGGALRVAIRGDDYPHDAQTPEAPGRLSRAHQAAERSVQRRFGFVSLTWWNDNVCESGEQAAALLEAVAAELETEGGAEQ